MVSNHESIMFKLEYLSNKSKVECDLCEPKFTSRNPFKKKKGEKNKAAVKLKHEAKIIFCCDDCYHEKSIGQIIHKFIEKVVNS